MFVRDTQLVCRSKVTDLYPFVPCLEPRVQPRKAIMAWPHCVANNLKISTDLMVFVDRNFLHHSLLQVPSKKK